MERDDPLHRFQFENSLIEMAHQQSSESITESKVTTTVITTQSTSNGNRIHLPVTTVNASAESLNYGSRTFVPRSGFEILDEMPSVHIEQTFELNENLTSVNSEHRFIVRSPLGESLFAASESSTERDRMIWGSKRPFQMHLLDPTHQEALTFQRRCSMGFVRCQKRYLEVWTPPGDLLGVVVEETTILSNVFTVKNESGHTAYRIKGVPTNSIGCCCFIPTEGHFDIYGFDSETIYGSITRKWQSDISQFTLNIYFTDINMSVKSKALLLGAGFMLEYLCFQSRF